MKVIIRFFIIVFVACSTVGYFGCSSSKTISLNSVKLTQQLQPGMSYTEVEEILGKPKKSSMVDNQWVVRWNLQEMWKGYVPYDFVFEPETKTLVSWQENTADFEKKQEQLEELTKVIEASDPGNANSQNAAPSFTNDQSLMNQFAGKYYSFSAVGGGQTGGTERTIILCPTGSYRSSSETGYSSNSGSANAWGSASQGGGDGTWRITGTINAGTLVTTSHSGSSTTYKFERCGNDCVYIGNTKFAYAGKVNCR